MTAEVNNLQLAEREIDEALELALKLPGGMHDPESLARIEVAKALALLDIAATLRKIASRMNGK